MVMKSIAAKSGILLIELVAIVVAIVSALGGYLYWRLERGPMELPIVETAIETLAERRLGPGFVANVDGVSASHAHETGRIVVTLVAPKIDAPSGDTVARADHIELAFSPTDMLRGAFGPRLIRIHGAAFVVSRDDPGKTERRRFENIFAEIFSPLTDGEIFHGPIEQIAMENARIEFSDRVSNRSWESQNASFFVRREPGGFSASAGGDLDTGSGTASVHAALDYTRASDIVALELESDAFPISDGLLMIAGEQTIKIDAPLSGRASLSMTSAGKLLDAKIDARVDRGAIRLPDREISLESINSRLAFDPDANALEIDTLDFDTNAAKGSFAGAVRIVVDSAATMPQAVTFDLTGTDIEVAQSDQLDNGLSIDRADLVGGFDVQSRRLFFSDLALNVVDVVIAGNLGFTFPQSAPEGTRPSMGVDADITIDGALNPERLLTLWPVGPGLGARDWVKDRLAAATIDNVRARMDLPVGGVGDAGLLPDDALSIEFDARDVTAFYVKRMTPLTAGKGRGVLRGNSFFLDVERARVGAVDITEGEIEFPLFVPKHQDTFYRFTAVGRTEDILGIIDETPLNLLSKINLSPEQFRGNGVAKIEVMRPNMRHVAPDEYEYRGTASFEDMTIDGLVGALELRGARGSVDLMPRSMTVRADTTLGEAPIDIVWTKNFFAQEDGPSKLSVSGVLDPSAGDALGFAMRQYMRGQAQFESTAIGEIGNFKTIDATADFTDTALTIDALGWSKATGAPANGALRMVYSDRAPTIESITLEGEGVSLFGGMSFDEDGALLSADFPTFFLEGAADLVLSAKRQEADEPGMSRDLEMTLTGSLLSAGPAIETYFARDVVGQGESGDDWSDGIRLDAQVKELILRNNVPYRDASLSVWRSGGALKELRLAASEPNGDPITLSLALTGNEVGPLQRIEARAGDIGSLLSGVFGLRSISGGDGSMSILLNDTQRTGMSGELEARNLKVVNAPLLARVFSAGSLEGLAGLLSGEGVDLSYAYGSFDYADNLLRLNDVHATGPSVGVTAEGAVKFGENRALDINGSLAPLYQINSVLGRAPIIGDLFINKEGEGLVAVSYGVEGDWAAPNVYVNPLSALTPGIMRRLLEPEPMADPRVMQPANDDAETVDEDASAERAVSAP
ncbi:MAG: AsmA-like C-terminal domain-containing protein [Pseudomonadota bacterium]